MAKISSGTTINEVDRIEKKGIGVVYRGTIDLRSLSDLLARGIIKYAPRYQRGFSTREDVPESEYDKLFLINDPKLQIDPIRARVMAVKMLRGTLYTSHITWNARHVDGSSHDDQYDSGTRSATFEGDITIPDTGHRHLAYFTAVLWKDHPEEIPESVDVDGTIYSEDKIIELLEDFDPEEEQVFLEIFTLDKASEGKLYDEFNADVKPPSGAVAIDLNPDKTPSRRFIYRVMEKSSILARSEVETRRNTIGNASRKLVTTPTMEAAVRPFTKQLAALEEAKDGRANDLIDFTVAFFDEYSHYYKAWQPKATAEQRWELRKQSFALSNIMMHPLFRLAYEMWGYYDSRKIDWHADDRWKAAIGKITGKVTNGKGKIEVLDRDNPAWRGRILIQNTKKDGSKSWDLSSTRQTRESAYQYLLSLTGFPPTTK